MSTISSKNDPYLRQLMIDYQPDRGTYKVGSGNGDDGHGVAARAEELSEAELNARFLEPQGLTATGGKYSTVDGVALTSSAMPRQNSSASYDTSQPILPNAQGALHDGSQLRDEMVWLQELEDAALLWEGLFAMAQGGRQDIQLSRRLKNHLQQAKLNAKSDEISAAHRRVARERDSAWVRFGTSLAAAAVAGGMGVASTTGHIWAIAAAQSVGQVVQSFGDAADKQWGPQRKANDAMIEEKRFQFAQESFDQAIEDTRSNEDEAREQYRSALKAINDHVDRQTDIIRKISNM